MNTKIQLKYLILRTIFFSYFHFLFSSYVVFCYILFEIQVFCFVFEFIYLMKMNGGSNICVDKLPDDNYYIVSEVFMEAFIFNSRRYSEECRSTEEVEGQMWESFIWSLCELLLVRSTSSMLHSWLEFSKESVRDTWKIVYSKEHDEIAVFGERTCWNGSR